ncbi:MAG: hypothetical protein LBI13_01560, partial [Streptococcaceae bacterium]|nr:hypothetical protein [Streptococcaceae bacterium]
QKTPFDIFLTHDFTGKQEEKDKQIRYYETEIAKKVKQEFPDITEIKFVDTSVDSNTGFWVSSFAIRASWTKGMPEEGTHTTSQPFTPERFSQDVYGISKGTPLLDKYYETGETTSLIKVDFSVGGKGEI